jgi:hypothetical protein
LPADALREQLFRVEWLGETDATDRDLARARGGKAGASAGKESRVKEAADWLRGYLKDGKARPSEDVKAAARRAGFPRNVLFEAKDEAGVTASNCGRYGGKWHWYYRPNPNGLKIAAEPEVADAKEEEF